jgi:hypothetical protein
VISRPSVRLMTRAWVLETVTQSWRHVSMFLGIWRVASFIRK